MPNGTARVRDQTTMILDFSFIYGGVRYYGRDLFWSEVGGEEVCRLHSLKITRCRKFYGSGEECVCWFENTGEKDSFLLEDLCDADAVLSVSAAQSSCTNGKNDAVTKLFGAKGSDWSRSEFMPFSNELCAGKTLRFSGSGGRPSQATLPFFDLNGGNAGYILAIGWTGQWFAEFSAENGEVRVRCGVEKLSFRLRPGEKIRTGSVFILSYRHGQNAGHNAFRRAILSALGMKAGDRAPLSLSLWGGTTSSYMCSAIERAKQFGFCADYVWIDAGWHGNSSNLCEDEFTDEWSKHTGDWRVNPSLHPDGLQRVAQAAKRAGSRLLLWFEPERAHRCVPAVSAHPEWFLQTEGDDFRNLLRLGDPSAYAYILEVLSSRIKALGVACYRQDLNMDPLPLWEKYDGEERKGILQIQHVLALYALWDALKARFPGLRIDNCSSGGRRLDWETTKRSFPLWRSDFLCAFDAPPEGAQVHGIGLSWWLPISGTGTKAELTDRYDFRSVYAAALNIRFFTYENRASANLEPLAELLKEYTRIRSFFTEDYYPIFGFDESNSVWGGWQYHSPTRDAGILCAFRRPDCGKDSVIVRPEGLNRDKVYQLVSMDGLPSALYRGEELRNNGLRIFSPERKSSRLFVYAATDRRDPFSDGSG